MIRILRHVLPIDEEDFFWGVVVSGVGDSKRRTDGKHTCIEAVSRGPVACMHILTPEAVTRWHTQTHIHGISAQGQHFFFRRYFLPIECLQDHVGFGCRGASAPEDPRPQAHGGRGSEPHQTVGYR